MKPTGGWKSYHTLHHPLCLKPACSFFLTDPFVRLRLARTLDDDFCKFRSMTFSESTLRTYWIQKAQYLQFCASLDIAPVPISALDLRRYIAFLASRLSFTSIRQYLNVVRLMHVESGHTNTLSDSWYLSSILKGLRRFKGDSTRPKLPMTCHILQRILSLLDLTRSFDFTF